MIYRGSSTIEDNSNIRVEFVEVQGGWDYTVYHHPGYQVNYVGGTAGPFEFFEDALDHAMGSEGQLAPADLKNKFDGWPGPRPPYVTPPGAAPIVPGQLWRFGRRRLRVLRYYLGPACMGGGVRGMRVSGRYIDASGRERGTQIVGRRSALSDYTEEGFRAKFRPVNRQSSDVNERPQKSLRVKKIR